MECVTRGDLIDFITRLIEGGCKRMRMADVKVGEVYFMARLRRGKIEPTSRRVKVIRKDVTRAHFRL